MENEELKLRGLLAEALRRLVPSPGGPAATVEDLAARIKVALAAPLAPSDTQGAQLERLPRLPEYGIPGELGYTTKQMQEYALAALAQQAPDAVRDAALEEAALVCDENAAWHRDTQRCADAIRALKSTAPKLAEAGKGE